MEALTLSELTQIVFNMELTHLDSYVSTEQKWISCISQFYK